MDGMEKITARIQEDADREIAAMNAQTDGQIAALQAQAQAQAEQERQTILARGQRAAAERLELLTALVLRAVTTGREQLIFYQKDRSRIGKAVVVAANEALVKEVAPELPDSLTDSKVGAFLGKMVNSATAQITGTGLLTLSEETRPIRGGFILVDGPVEVNCSFESMLRLQREKLEKPAAEILFGDRR